MKKIQDELKAKGLEKKVAGVIKMSDALLKTGMDLRGKLFGQIIAAFGGNLRYIVCGGAPLGKDAVGFFKSIGVDILEGYGITYDLLPEWQRKGVNIQWHAIEKEGWNPVTQTKTVTTRKELRNDLRFPNDFPRDSYKFDID